MVAADCVAVLAHDVEAEGGARVAQGLVPVRGDAALAIDAAGQRSGRGIGAEWPLGDQVDRTRRRAAAGVGARRALGHFDLLDIEDIARDRAEVADAVDEDARGAVEAAHVHGIAGAGVAVFADIERAHAGTIAQRLGQGGRALLVEQVLADDVDRLRRVLQGLRELRRGRRLHQVALGALGLDVDLVQRLGVIGRAVGMRQRRGQQQRGGSQRGRAGGAREDVLAALDAHLSAIL